MSPSRYDDDSDDERLPEGMTRVGYDADTQVYTFRDADGSYWEGAPGCKYGRLTRVGGGHHDHHHHDRQRGDEEEQQQSQQQQAAVDDADPSDSAPFLHHGPDRYDHLDPRPSWRQDMMPFLNFGVLAGLFLIALFWFLYRSPATTDPSESSDVQQLVSCPGSSLVIQPGDTCWALAEERAFSVQELEVVNPRLDCARLPIGSLLCLPD